MTRMTRATVVILAGLITLSATAASAQTERRVGFVLAYPGTIGLEWQAASKVAIRVDGDYQHDSFESTSQIGQGLAPFGVPPIEITTRIASSEVGLGVSVLIDLHRSDALRLYLAPSIGVNFVRSTYQTEFNGDPARLAFVSLPADTEVSDNAPRGGIALGASRDLSDRFRVFGEGGFRYVRGSVQGFNSDDSKSTSFGLRAGVGVVLLF